MKLFLKGLMVLSMLSSVIAKADSGVLFPKRVVLQSIVSPFIDFHHQLAGESEIKVITVSSAKVIGATCKQKQVIDNRVSLAALKQCKNVKVLDKFDTTEYRQLLSLIINSSEGELKDNGDVFCLALPTEQFSYRANNGKMLLSEGARPCSRIVYNDSESAQELVDILEQYEQEYKLMINQRSL